MNALLDLICLKEDYGGEWDGNHNQKNQEYEKENDSHSYYDHNVYDDFIHYCILHHHWIHGYRIIHFPGL